MRKKQLSESRDAKPYDNELSLTRLALQLHPKSSESLAHRRWIVKKLTEISICRISYLLTRLGPSAKADHDRKTQLESHFKDQRHKTEEPKSKVMKTDCSDSGDKHSTENTTTHLQSLKSDAPSKGTIVPSNSNELGSEIQALLDIALNEFSICKAAGEKQKCNYNAWAHRSWTTDQTVMACARTVCSIMRNPRPTGNNELNKAGVEPGLEDQSSVNAIVESVLQTLLDFIQRDYNNLREFSERHVSDISVFNALIHCQLCVTDLALILAEKFSSQKLEKPEILDRVLTSWQNSLSNNSKLLEIYGSHEALWCHRRNIITAFRKNVLVNFPEIGRFHSVADTFSHESDAKFCATFPSWQQDPQDRYLARNLKFYEKFLT